MDKQNFKRRFISPVAIVFAVMAVSFVVYNLSRYIGNDALQQILAAVSGTTYFLAVAFGAPFIYSTAYMRGASFKERILASAVNPFIWATKECIRLYTSHKLLECLYWYLNPLNFWLLFLMVLEIGVADIFCRRMMKKKGVDVRVANPVSLIAVLISLFCVISAYAWGRGENLYVIFLKGYRLLFGSGL